MYEHSQAVLPACPIVSWPDDFAYLSEVTVMKSTFFVSFSVNAPGGTSHNWRFYSVVEQPARMPHIF